MLNHKSQVCVWQRMRKQTVRGQNRTCRERLTRTRSLSKLNISNKVCKVFILFGVLNTWICFYFNTGKFESRIENSCGYIILKFPSFSHDSRTFSFANHFCHQETHFFRPVTAKVSTYLKELWGVESFHFFRTLLS